MVYLAAFLEGIVTFVSPCLLPLLPVYLAFFAGGVGGGDDGARRSALPGACAFVLGFGIPFTLMGAFAGVVGSLLLAWQRVLDVLCGGFVVLMGLSYLGVVKLSLFDRAAGMGRAASGQGLLGAFLLGVTFSVGWTPCVGTFLASALSLAASSGGMVRGMVMLGCYSLGLGVPFVLSAVLVEQVESAAGWVKRHYGVVDKACGMLLVVVGLLMASGQMGAWMRLLAG